MSNGKFMSKYYWGCRVIFLKPEAASNVSREQVRVIKQGVHRE